VAPDVGYFDVPELAQAMKLEWSDEALADLDRFVEFLNQQQPSLAPLVAKEIVDKVQVLSAHPQLGRPITGREEKLSFVVLAHLISSSPRNILSLVVARLDRAIQYSRARMKCGAQNERHGVLDAPLSRGMTT